MTNGDCVRRWADEDLAYFTAGLIKRTTEAICKEIGVDYTVPDEHLKNMRDAWLAWLKQEADGDGEP